MTRKRYALKCSAEKENLPRYCALSRTLSNEEKAVLGKRSNEIKKLIEDAIDEKKAALSEVSADQLCKDEWLDVTLDKPALFQGKRPHAYSFPGAV